MPAEPLGPLQQTPTEQYPCLGGCGVHMSASGLCLRCWEAQHTYGPEQVRMLPPDDPRRARVRPTARSRWRSSR